ncbi:hypothetical protein TrVE_jg7497 [Triparma verrucosa]|uniref:Uncharacterized protein n=2 Tax=Triparma TaxID=722752 RepID=A0A9W7AUD2_9STRA|nr:hypothetical protein TrST_g7961 [Triparma strigata]GMI12309.1 hypothetical protein TrVE_jg7497 [Triparma verrucosa]
MKFALLTTLFAAASAFQTAPVAKTNSALNAGKDDLKKIAAASNPVVNFYDPLSLADAEFWGDSNEATIGFLRHAEIKHGRVAMFAFVGYCVQSNVHWPWPMTTAGDSFPSTDLSPEAQWDAIPEAAKWQILVVISFLELWGEQSGADTGQTHYMRGGQPGKFPSFDLFRNTVHPVPFNLYDPFGLSKSMSAEKKEKRLIMELNNGRLAQIGIMGFLAADKVPGSVPALNGIAQPYDGDVMAPFTAHYHLFN